MTAGCHLHRAPVTGTVARSAWPAAPRPRNAGCVRYGADDTAPKRARAYTRFFLGYCAGIGTPTVQTAELLVSELITNASTSSPPHTLITLSLRHFPARLLIEVIDTSPDPPVPAGPDPGSLDEHGRGLLLVSTLADEWGWFPLGDGRKDVYAVLPVPARLPGGKRPAPAHRNTRKRPARTLLLHREPCLMEPRGTAQKGPPPVPRPALTTKRTSRGNTPDRLPHHRTQARKAG